MKKKTCKRLIMLLLICALTAFDILTISRQIVQAEESQNQYNAEIAIIDSIEKYINYKVSDEDKVTVVQYNLKTGIQYGENNAYYPIETSEINMNFMQIDNKYPYEVKVITKSTQLTNGKIRDAESSYNYDENTGILNIFSSNKDENGDLIYSSKQNDGVVDEYSIICYYDTYTENKDERKVGFDVTAKYNIEKEENNQISNNCKFEMSVTEDIGTITSINTVTDDIYNGYIKSNVINGTRYTTTYKEIKEINISKKEAQNKITILEDNRLVRLSEDYNGDKVVGTSVNSSNIIYKSSVLRKENILNVLGENGSVEILDENGNILSIINKDSQFDENGNITILYDSDISNIKIRTSEIVTEGIIYIENEKEIPNSLTEFNDLGIRTIDNITGINEDDEEIYSAENQNIIEIKNSETNISMNLNNSNWTNKQQNEVTFDISLDASSYRNNLFHEASLKIELPNEVEKVILKNSSIIYGNGIELENPYVEIEEDGSLSIIANLIGKQIEYNENNLGLITNVKIDATIILKKDIEVTNNIVNLVLNNKYNNMNRVETSNFITQIEIENYQENIIEQEKEDLNYDKSETTNTTLQENIDGLKLEVSPMKADTKLENGDTIYEGEFIKYNIKISNESDEDINNVKVLGVIPEGATYGELEADYDSYGGKYEYNFDKDVREKTIEIGTIEAGSTYETFYEVQIDDLIEGETQKDIDSSIKSYVGETEVNEYSLNNVVKEADAKVFVGAVLDNSKYKWAYVINATSELNEEMTLTFKAPKEFEFVAAWQSMGIDADVSEDNVITIKITPGKPYYIGGYIRPENITIKTDNNEVQLNATADLITSNNSIYKSNEVRILYKYPDAEVQISSPNEGEEIRYGENIEYNIVINATGGINNGKEYGEAVDVNLKDYLPDDVEAVSFEYETWEEIIDEDSYYEDSDGNISYITTGEFNKIHQTESIQDSVTDEDGNRLPQIDQMLKIPCGETAHIKILTTAGLVEQKTVVENMVTISGDEISTKNSNVVSHIILPYDYEEGIEEPVDPEDPDTPIDPDKPIDPGEEEEPDKGNYDISGVAWLDSNNDGNRQSTENVLSGIKVMLVNIKDANSVVDSVETNSNGDYKFSNVQSGDYIVVFIYDTSNYNLTEYKKGNVPENVNSDVSSQRITLNGNSILVAVTDIISVNSNITNIDIGLVENKICDVRLDKYVSKIIVDTATGTKVYSYDNEKLAKIEIKSKEIEYANVTIEYKIVVTNEGQVPVNIGSVKDYLPDGFSLAQQSNNMWTQDKNNELINVSMANQILNAGEKRILTLVVTKKMTSDSTGSYINKAEIWEATNGKNLADIDSRAGNKVEDEDDFSKAEVIIAVSTGQVIIYISIIFVVTAIVIIGLVLIKKYGLPKNSKTALLIIIMLNAILTVSMSEVQAADAPGTAYFSWCRNIYCGNHSSNSAGSTHFIGSSSTGDARCVSYRQQPYTGIYSLRSGYDNVGYSHSTNKYWIRGENGWVEKSSPVSTIISGNTTSLIAIEALSETNDYLIGPFTIESPSGYGAGYTFSITDKNGNSITSYSITNEEGTNITVKGASTFYVRMSEGALANGIGNVKVSTPLDSNNVQTAYCVETINYNSGQAVYIKSGYQDIRTDRKFTYVTGSTNTYSGASITWTKFTGVLDIIKVDADNNNVTIQEVTFRVQNSSGYNETFTTDENGKIHIDNLVTGTYTLTEISNPNYGYTREVIGTVSVNSGQIVEYKLENTKQTGNLKIQKRDMDSGVGLSGVSFKIKNSKGQYIIAINNNNTSEQKVTGSVHLSNILTTTNVNSATEFVTDDEGNIEICNILIDTYQIIETSVGDNYGYALDDAYVTWESGNESGNGLIATIEIIRQTSDNTSSNTSESNTLLTIKNRRKYVKFSGYVWEDIVWSDGKNSLANELYQDIEDDKNDKLLENVMVRLKDKNGNQVTFRDSNGNDLDEIQTDKDGKYTLWDIEIDKLDQYYIEFTYNGMSYANVNYTLDKVNGSKAGEGQNRTEYNNNYASIVQGASKDQNGNRKYTLKYDSYDYKSDIIYNTESENKLQYGYEEQKYPIYGTDENFLISSTTQNAYRDESNGKEGYLNDIKSAEEIRKSGIEEVENINLGLKERERPDMSVVKDLYSAKVSINNEAHIYKYDDRFNTESKYGNGYGYNIENLHEKFNDVGVAFQEKYASMSYTRALYASDIKYENNDNSKELEVRVTYKIGIKNNASTINAKIYELQDYFDSKYELVNVGKEINEDGSIKEDTMIDGITSTTCKDNDEYQTMTIKYNGNDEGKELLTLKPLTEGYIYVELKVKNENLIDIVDRGVEVKLDNVVEITSYGSTVTTSLDENENILAEEIYAGIDKDSQPGNLNINDRKTWEDDTDKAPGLLIILQEARSVSGQVFLDESGDFATGEIRQGNGQLDENEKGIEGVIVKLQRTDGNIAEIYTDNNWIEASTITDENGEYTLQGFLPGEYVLTYTWGDKTYKVQDYKSTIVNNEAWNGKNNDNQWYKDEFKQKYTSEWNKETGQEIRVSDAVDNYQERENIDSQANEMTYGQKQKIENAYSDNVDEGNDLETKITSITPNFKVNLEYITDITDIRDEYETSQDGELILDGNNEFTTKEGFKNNIRNIDLGLAERARQVLSLDKHIKSVKVTLADGNVLINAVLDEDGNLVDKVQYVTAIPKSAVNGQVKLEIDQEIIQGATLTIEYDLKVTNNSEVEYLTQDFYMYGKGYGEETERLVTLRPALLIDYLDNNIASQIDINPEWNMLDSSQKKDAIDNGILSEQLKDTLNNTQKVMETDSANVVLSPIGNQRSINVSLRGYKLLANNEEIYLQNFAEIVKVIKNGGSTLITTPGNYVPGLVETSEQDDSQAEDLVILPPTGLLINYIPYVLLVISSLGILVSGVVLIKKYVLGKGKF